MEGPIEPVQIPRPPEGWWERVPVLRELYRLLSSTDPVNWELARQVGVALACFDEPEAGDLDAARVELEAMSRAADVQASELTGLVAETYAPVEAVTRGRWVEENIACLRLLLEPLAAKLMGGALLPEPLGTALRQVTGLLFGLQAGFVLGYLGRHVLAQYELMLPQPDGGRLLYVVPNLRALERDWQLEGRELRYWIALHEVTHHLELSRPWARRYFLGQLRTLIDSLDLDPERLQAALGELDLLDPQRLVEALENPEVIVQAAWTPLGRDAAGRLQAFVTLAEGYSMFVMDAVGAKVLAGHARLREVTERRKRELSPGEVLLERLLGLDLKRRQYEDGVRFCRYVAAVRDVETLNRVWDNPDSLPTMAEIADPDAWIARVAEGA